MLIPPRVACGISCRPLPAIGVRVRGDSRGGVLNAPFRWRGVEALLSTVGGTPTSASSFARPDRLLEARGGVLGDEATAGDCKMYGQCCSCSTTCACSPVKSQPLALASQPNSFTLFAPVAAGCAASAIPPAALQRQLGTRDRALARRWQQNRRNERRALAPRSSVPRDPLLDLAY